MKYLKEIVFIIFMLFNSTVNAEELTGITTPECEVEIKSLFSSVGSDIDIEDMNFNISSCAYDIFIDNLSNRITYYVYGDIVIDFLKVASVALNKDGSKIEAEFTKSEPIYFISSLIKVFTKVINYIALSILGFVYVKLLIKNQGSMDKQFAKNSLKVFFGLSLIVPMEFFGGYSLLQSLVIFAILASIFLGNVIWAVSALVIEIFSIGNVINIEKNTINQSDLIESNKALIELVIPNIEAQLCDIRKIENAITLSLPSEKTLETLNETSLYKCLKGETKELDLNSNVPRNLNQSRSCLLENKFIDKDDYNSYCGAFSYSNEDVILKLRDSLSILDIDYQNKIRSIALSVHEGLCYVKNHYNPISNAKPFSCVKQNLNYVYEFDENKNMFITMNKPTDADWTVNQDSVSHVSDLIKSSILSDSMAGDTADTIKLVSATVLTTDNKRLDKHLNIIFSSLKNGWMGSPSLYFSNTAMSFEKSDIIENLKKVLNLEYNSSTNQYNSGVAGYTERDISYFTRRVIDNFQDNSNQSEDPLKRSIPHYSIFNIINSPLLNTNGVSDCFTNSNQSDSSKDYCKSSSINPFYNIIKDGQNIVQYTAPSLALLGLSSAVFSKSFDMKIHLIDTISSYMSLLFAIGIFFSFFLPLIPFLVFASTVIQWIVNSFKTLLAIQFTALMYLIPDENEDFDGQEAVLYKMILNIVITPFFLVLGLLVSFIMIHFSISITNATFSIIVQFLNIPFSPTGLMEQIENAAAIFLYTVIVTLLVIKSSTVIYEIPQTLQKWFGLHIDTGQGMFRSIEGVAKRVIYMQV